MIFAQSSLNSIHMQEIEFEITGFSLSNFSLISIVFGNFSIVDSQIKTPNRLNQVYLFIFNKTNAMFLNITLL